jgi:hypothetical protein
LKICKPGTGGPTDLFTPARAMIKEPTQADIFKELARESEADRDEAAFKKRLEKIAKPPKAKKLMSKEFERDRDGHIRSRKTRHFSPGTKIFINLALIALGALLFHWLVTEGAQSHSAPKAIGAPTSN